MSSATFKFYPGSADDAFRAEAARMSVEATDLQKRFVHYLATAQVAQDASEGQVLEIWELAARKSGDGMKVGDVFFAPNKFDATLDESDIDSELRSLITVLTVTDVGNAHVAFRAVGLLGVLGAEGPEPKAELIRAFRDSVFDDNGVTTIAREGTFLALLEDEDEGGNDGVRALRKSVRQELERVDHLVKKASKKTTTSAPPEEGRVPPPSARRTAGIIAASDTSHGNERVVLGIEGEDGMGLGSRISSESKGVVTDHDGNKYYTGKKGAELFPLIPRLTFLSRLLSPATFRYLAEDRGYVISGPEIIDAMDKAVARGNLDAVPEVKHLSRLGTIRSLAIFSDTTATTLFFEGKFEMDYARLSLAHFVRGKKAVQLKGASNAIPISREVLFQLRDQLQCFLSVMAVMAPLPDGMLYNHIIEALEGAEGYKFLVFSVDYARFRAERAVATFMHTMANGKGPACGYDLTTREGIWGLLVNNLLDEAIIKITVYESLPHTAWVVSMSGYRSVILAQEASAAPPAGSSVIKEEKDNKRGNRKKKGKKRKEEEEGDDNNGKKKDKLAKRVKNEPGDSKSKQHSVKMENNEEKSDDEQGTPCAYGIMTLRGIRDPFNGSIVVCAVTLGSRERCSRCEASGATKIKDVARHKEEERLEAFEEKANKKKSERMKEMAAQWRKAL